MCLAHNHTAITHHYSIVSHLSRQKSKEPTATYVNAGFPISIISSTIAARSSYLTPSLVIFLSLRIFDINKRVLNAKITKTSRISATGISTMPAVYFGASDVLKRKGPTMFLDISGELLSREYPFHDTPTYPVHRPRKTAALATAEVEGKTEPMPESFVQFYLSSFDHRRSQIRVTDRVRRSRCTNRLTSNQSGA